MYWHCFEEHCVFSYRQLSLCSNRLSYVIMSLQPFPALKQQYLTALRKSVKYPGASSTHCSLHMGHPSLLSNLCCMQLLQKTPSHFLVLHAFGTNVILPHILQMQSLLTKSMSCLFPTSWVAWMPLCCVSVLAMLLITFNC